MKFMVLVKATAESEAGRMPRGDMLAKMGAFNVELAKAGVLLAGEGLHPSIRGLRVRFEGEERTVSPGPFPAKGELVSGYGLWQTGSMEEALAWLKRAPFYGGAEVELRQVFSPEEFTEMHRELRKQEERLRRETEGR